MDFALFLIKKDRSDFLDLKFDERKQNQPGSCRILYTLSVITLLSGHENMDFHPNDEILCYFFKKIQKTPRGRLVF